MEIHYYLSSLAADEKRLADHIRAHWGVESFHHVLDLTFGEDHCQIRGIPNRRRGEGRRDYDREGEGQAPEGHHS